MQILLPPHKFKINLLLLLLLLLLLYFTLIFLIQSNYILNQIKNKTIIIQYIIVDQI